MDGTACLGPYEIKGFLTDVGLDDLYLARDTDADAEVLIRVLPVFVDEAAIIERLRERARRISTLDHPGLVSPSRVKKFDGAVLAITKRLDGRALDRFIPPEGLLLRDVFDLTLALVAAVGALHADGHLHGYLHAGRVLVATAREPRLLVIGPEEGEDKPPPRVVAYRSPEVCAGDEVDEQAEVFSLGVLLHQIATGELPFSGETSDELAESIQNDDAAPITDIRKDLPRELAVIVARCLKKNRQLRYASVKDVHADLTELKEKIIEGKVSTRRKPQDEPEPEKERELAAPAAARTISLLGRRVDMLGDWRLPLGGAAALVMAFVFGYALGGSEAAPATSWTVERATSGIGPELFPRLSPDGSRLFFSRAEDGDWGVYSLRMGDPDAVELTPDSPFGDTQPALSADGSRIAFRSERDGGGIFIMGADGSSVRRLVDSGFNPAWAPDGSEIAVGDASVFDTPYLGVPGPLWVINVATGTKRQVSGAAGLQPDFSPNGDRIAYWASRAISGSDIWTIPAAGGEPVAVTNDASTAWNPVWSPAGDYVYFTSDRSGSFDIWRVPIDEGSGEVQGPTEPVTNGAGTRSIHPSFARGTGAMAYVEATTVRQIYRIPFDPSSGTVTGLPEPLPSAPRDAAAPDLSADGELIAFTHGEGDKQQVWVANLDGTGSVRIGHGDARPRNPRFSPDGERVAFLADHDGYVQLWTAAADGGALRRLTELTASKISQPVWSRDGASVGLTIGAEMMPTYTLLFDANQAPEEQVADTLHSSYSDSSFEPHSWSRDGAQMAGSIRNHRGRLSGIAVLAVRSEKYEALTSFGMNPVWLRDGRRLLFQWGSGLYLVDTRAPEPRRVFSSVPDSLGEVFSLSSDDRWIYVSLDRTEADAWLLKH